MGMNETSDTGISDQDVLDAVQAVILDNADLGIYDDVFIESANTYDEEGVLTTDLGLVVRLSNGAEYQLTLVRSR
jgi:hypothetical protein